MKYIVCKECGAEYSPEEDDECPICEEMKIPKGTKCEFCDELATHYIQDHPVCEEHYKVHIRLTVNGTLHERRSRGGFMKVNIE
jgi:hypothetical protein